MAPPERRRRGLSTVTHPFKTGAQTPVAATSPTARICITNMVSPSPLPPPPTGARLWDAAVLVDGVILEIQIQTDTRDAPLSG